jgi:membrane fusion protein (multidrug efflux system)
MKKFFYLPINSSFSNSYKLRKSETTDNAQLETDIGPVIPKINSTVFKGLVRDNQAR